MTERPPDTLLNHVRKLVAGQMLRNSSDRELLDGFVDGKDEAAFAALMERHGAMTLGVCRRLLRNLHDAEDACQATFLVLARKASSIRRKESVGSWLHGVAFRVASDLKKRVARRRAGPAIYEGPGGDTIKEVTWREAQAVLDQELKRLPDCYRAPLILCYLEGKTRDEAAKQLGWELGALKNKLERARSLLRAGLTRRGIAPSIGLLSAALAETAQASMPATLALSTAKAASLIVRGGAVSPNVLATHVVSLTEGVLRTMLLIKLKSIAVVFTVAAMLGGAAGGWLTRDNLAAQDRALAATAGSDKKPESEPRQSPKTGTRDVNKKPKDDKENLQGIWKGDIVELFGLSAKKANGPWKVDLRIEGDQLTLRGPVWARGIGSNLGPLSTAVDNEFTFKVNSGKDPAEIDLTRKPDPDDPDNDGLPRVVLGVFVLKGDTLQVCLGLERNPRPTELKSRNLASANYAKHPDVLLVLKRATGANWEKLPKEGVPPPATQQESTNKESKEDKDLAVLQGTWEHVSEKHNGKEGNLIFKTYRFTFKGNELTTAWEREDDGKTGGGTNRFTIDSTKNPKELTITGDNLKIQAIYKLEKDELTIAHYGRPEKARPRGFTSADAGGDELILVVKVLKREKQPKDNQGADVPPEPKQDLQAAILEEIEKRGGKVERDENAPGKPVVVVNVNWPGLPADRLDDGFVKRLAPLSKLRKLHLGNHDITDEGLRLLPQFKELEQLDLAFNKQITDAGLKYLESIKTLQAVRLSFSGATEQGIATLQQALPKTKIVAK